jgi:hypothetical protein
MQDRFRGSGLNNIRLRFAIFSGPYARIDGENGKKFRDFRKKISPASDRR